MITLLDNQVVKFYTDDELTVAEQMDLCGTRRQSWCNLVECGDTTSFQVGVDINSEIGYRILNCDTDAVVYEDFDSNTVQYSRDVPYASEPNVAQVDFTWCEGYEFSDAGCYRIDLYDLIFEDEGNKFVDGDNGTMEANVNGLTGMADTLIHDNTQARTGSWSGRVTSNGAAGFVLRNNTNIDLQEGCTYDVIVYGLFNVSHPSKDAQVELQIRDGFTDAVFTTIDIWDFNTENGGSVWYKIHATITVGSDTTGRFRLYLSGSEVADTNTWRMYFDDWTVIVNSPFCVIGGTLIASSDCFCLQEHPCSVLLEWTNTENAFGFNYEDLPFIQYKRVNARLGKPTYNTEKEIFKYSNGHYALLFARREKSSELWLDKQPEFIHDALSVGFQHDEFYIDNVEYINIDDEYEPEWEDNILLSKARTHFRIKEPASRNVNPNC